MIIRKSGPSLASLVALSLYITTGCLIQIQSAAAHPNPDDSEHKNLNNRRLHSSSEAVAAAASNGGVVIFNNYEANEQHHMHDDHELLLNQHLHDELGHRSAVADDEDDDEHDDEQDHDDDLHDIHHDPDDLFPDETGVEESGVTPSADNGHSGSHADLELKDKILFVSNFTKCKMFTKKCIIRVIITDVNITLKWTVRSSDRKIMDLKQIEACNFNTTTVTTPLAKSSAPLFLSAAAATSSSVAAQLNSSLVECMSIEKLNRNRAYTSRNFFLIRVKPKLVGIKYMEFVFTDAAVSTAPVVVIRHKVVITSPDRLIDTIQMIYVVFFSVVIAVIMGILIDLDTLIKIIKMPVAVIIGFVSQYLFMPLVSVFEVFFNHVKRAELTE
jgi:hypothetical protein